MTDTSDKRIDAQMHLMQNLHAEEVTRADLDRWRELLHAVRSERNMLAYEKGGHILWKRYAQ